MKNEHQQLENYLNTRLASSTVGSYLYIINRFLAHYPNASNLSLNSIEEYFTYLKQNGATVRYRGVVIASIKAYYDFLLDIGKIKSHPCRYLKTETKPTGINFGEFLSIQEMELLIKVKEHRFPVVMNRDRAIIGLLIYQGMTSQELISLKVSDIDFDMGTVHIQGCRKNRSRTLSLQPSQVIVLINYIEVDRKKLASQKTNKLFISMRGLPMTVDSIHALISRLAVAFDKEVSPANIRKSVINYWLNERKILLEDVQIMAGHRYPSTTQRYINTNTPEQREALSRLHLTIFCGGSR